MAALIEPPTHADTAVDVLFFLGGAGAIAASFFVPPLAAVIALRVVGGLVIWASLWDDGNGDHDNILVIYKADGIGLNPAGGR